MLFRSVEVNDPKLAEILSKGGKVHANTLYRLPTQISGIRRVEKLEVVAIRTGKTVIAYEFPALQALATPVVTAPSVQEPVAVGV